jgi:protein-disulfide isomerase
MTSIQKDQTMQLTRRAILATATATLILPRLARAQDNQLTPEAVYFDPDAPALGNPDGDVTIAEFFDYQCPYCKAGHPDLMSVVAEDGNVRLVLKDWPILSAASIYAAQLGLGSVDMGHYPEVNHALMQTTGRLDEDIVDAAVATVVDPKDAMAAYKQSRAKWDGLLQRNQQQAAAFGFGGTPAFVIGTQFYGGVMDQTALKDAISTARQG